MTLFVRKDFIGHSGGLLHWKVECDALTPEDWSCLAYMALETLGNWNWSDVIGVPRGGIVFAEAIKLQAMAHQGRPRLIVDDVLTSGGSLIKAMTQPGDVGLVVFARGPLPRKVKALFAMPPAMDAEFNRGFDMAASAGPA